MKLFLKILPVFFVIAAVVLYFALPTIAEWVLDHSKGMRGLLFLELIGIALMLYYWKVIGYDTRTLIYALCVVIFAILSIWLIANREMVFLWLKEGLGVWGMVFVLIGFCIIYYFVMKVLF